MTHFLALLRSGTVRNRWTHSGVTPMLETHIEVRPSDTSQNEDRNEGSGSMLEKFQVVSPNAMF